MFDKILVVVAAILGLPFGWYLSTSFLERAVSVQFVFHRVLAGILGGVSLAGAVYLWRIKERSFQAFVVITLGILAIVGLGVLMGRVT